MSGVCKLCSADPEVRAKLEQATRDGEAPKQVVKLAEAMGLTISHMAIIRHWQNHVVGADDTKGKPPMPAKYDITADMQPNPLIIDPDDVINDLQAITDNDENTSGLLTDLLEQLVLNTGLVAHKKMQSHMSGDSRFPNEEIKALISLIQLSTERSTTKNPTVSALSKRLNES